MAKIWPILIVYFAAVCPWLSSATAEGFLSGPVKTVVTEGSCRFTGTVSELAIELKADSCGKDRVAMRGIGNEASVCTSKDAEKVVSRVREKHFTVTITSTDKAVRDRAPRVAEQVAGSLF